MNLSLAYSTCPNDTFLFHALVHGLVPLHGLSYNVSLDDVESLNQKAGQGFYQISKLSFAAIGNLLDTYGLLRSGAALGRGCGPLVVARKGADVKSLKRAKIAVPGLQTTANLLLGLFIGYKPDVTPMVFDRIMPAVSSGDFDFGVIIHEGRFTYPSYGLELVEDLGAWWESETSLPIPLGGIAVRRDLSAEVAGYVESSIAESVRYGFQNPEASKNYVKYHAQELAEDVIHQHIALYVNDFTVKLGDEGEKAVTCFFELARQKGLMKSGNHLFFR
jgi:1,4-dihydroxy-6-naphthoate synthase